MGKEPTKTAKTLTGKAILDFLLDIPLFDKLDTEELIILSKYMSFVDVEPGEILFREGDSGDYVCFVVEGSLDVVKKAEKRDYVTLATLSKGRSIGEMAVIDDFPRSATVRVRAKGTLVILTRQGFEIILEQHPGIGVKVLKGISRLLSQNLRKTSSRLVDYMLPLS